MKKNLVASLAATFILGIATTAFAANLTDVPANHWAYGAVNKLVSANLIEGYGDGTFRGDKPMSRYEIAIMTAKALDRYDGADDAQKKMIDSLSAEFAAEMNKMGVRVAKVEAKTNTWVTGGDMRVRFHTNSPKTPGGARLQGADQFDWRGRVAIAGQLNENWKVNARFTSPWSNRFGNSDGNPGASVTFDIFNMQGTNIMGVDAVRVGRNWFTMGNGLMNKSAAVDGIWLNEKIGKTDSMFFIGNTKQSTAAANTTGDASTFAVGQLSWKLQDNLKVGAAYYVADIEGTSNTLGTGLLLTDNGAYYKRSKGYNLFASYKTSGLTMLGEFVSSSLENAVNMPDNPKGWAVQVSNGSGPGVNAFFGNVPLVNIKKVGDTAWLLGYRRIESGATPPSLGGFDQLAVSSSSGRYGVFMHGTDNVKGWMASLEKTVDKNLTVNLTVQGLSVVNRGLTTALTSDKLDTATVLTTNFWF